MLDPVDVTHTAADVTGIDTSSRTVTTTRGKHTYDRLVIALGSQVVTPDLPGLHEFGYDVDTYDGATRLQRHLEDVSRGPHTPATATVIVVGAGLTGIETACELPSRLSALGPGTAARVILIDHNQQVGSDMGSAARPVIEAALTANGVHPARGPRRGGW